MRSARPFRARSLGDGSLSDLRAKLAREEAVEEAQGVNAAVEADVDEEEEPL